MSRYYFHYRDPSDKLFQDRVGAEFRSLDQAEQEARTLAFEILEQSIEAGEAPDAPRCIEVVDEDGEDVLYLPFWAEVQLLESGLKHKQTLH